MTQNRRLMRQDFLDVMDVTWARYVPTIIALTEEDQARYARAEGYNDIKELIAHLSLRLQQLLDVIPALAEGEAVTIPDEDANASHARAVESARDQTLEQVAADFNSLQDAVAGMLGDLPDTAFERAPTYDWLYRTLIEHYQAHEPPGEPQNPAAQHGGARPAPGEHIMEDNPPQP